VSDYGNNPADPNKPDPNQPPPNQPPPPPDWSQPTQPSADQPPAGQGDPGYYGSQQFGQPQYGGQQPFGAPYGQPASEPPQNYLVWAVLTTLLCCPPLGIPSIIYAARVNAMFEGGNIAGAQESSRKAKQFAIWSAASIVLVYGVIILIAVIAAASSDNS
jgi:hypothetical protein